MRFRSPWAGIETPDSHLCSPLPAVGIDGNARLWQPLLLLPDAGVSRDTHLDTFNSQSQIRCPPMRCLDSSAFSPDRDLARLALPSVPGRQFQALRGGVRARSPRHSSFDSNLSVVADGSYQALIALKMLRRR